MILAHNLQTLVYPEEKTRTFLAPYYHILPPTTEPPNIRTFCVCERKSNTFLLVETRFTNLRFSSTPTKRPSLKSINQDVRIIPFPAADFRDGLFPPCRGGTMRDQLRVFGLVME